MARPPLRSACAILFLVAQLCPPLRAEESRPHIVFVLADDMGVGDLGCYGGKIAPTPNIDRLAQEGIRFTKYYSASPICSPSRCGLITGHFPARWNLTSYLQTRAGNRQCEQVDFLDGKAATLPRLLKVAGYATAHIGKWHLGGGRDVVDPPKFSEYGYDVGLGTWESPEPAPGLDLESAPGADPPAPPRVARDDRTRWMVDEALAFLKKNSARPCFINLWLDDPHTPWVPKNAKPKSRESRECLTAVLEQLDKQMGRLMDGVPRNTLLMFASDNGALPTFKGERSCGLRGSKLSLYEGGIRVPFIVRWPGIAPAGQVDDTTVIQAVDILPTLASIGHGPFPKAYKGDGENLSDAFRGVAKVRVKPLFWEYGRNDKSFVFPAAPDRSPNVAMREGKWKLLANADGSNMELYDLAADPNETTDVSATHAEVAAKMKATALEWRKSMPKLPQ